MFKTRWQFFIEINGEMKWTLYYFYYVCEKIWVGIDVEKRWREWLEFEKSL
jgi:hypothetical protein